VIKSTRIELMIDKKIEFIITPTEPTSHMIALGAAAMQKEVEYGERFPGIDTTHIFYSDDCKALAEVAYREMVGSNNIKRALKIEKECEECH